MSPEQARGKDVDKRTDIWGFGCVLYEMLTGKRAFAGEEVSDTLAEVLKAEPDWSALPATAPESIRRLLRRCLAKDRHARLSDASVARLKIDDAKDGAASQPPPAIAAKSRVRQLIPLLSTAFIAAALALVAWRLSTDPPADHRDVTTFTIQLPADAQLASGNVSRYCPSLEMDGASHS
jgi:serine/threonine protein kinase